MTEPCSLLIFSVNINLLGHTSCDWRIYHIILVIHTTGWQTYEWKQMFLLRNPKKLKPDGSITKNRQVTSLAKSSEEGYYLKCKHLTEGNFPNIQMMLIQQTNCSPSFLFSRCSLVCQLLFSLRLGEFPIDSFRIVLNSIFRNRTTFSPTSITRIISVTLKWRNDQSSEMRRLIQPLLG
jgi:hypothetical protein